MIRHIALLAAAFAGLLTAVSAAQTARNATPQDDFKYLSASDTAALLNKPGPAPVVSLLSDHETYFSEVVARSSDGEVEVHQHWIDFVTVLSGEATLTVGGTVAGGKETAPGEMRGGVITGGRAIVLHRGDYFEVPADMPHLMTGPKHNFSYLVVKVRV
jgi:quercetin dioxygenase-like cupin family protein